MTFRFSERSLRNMQDVDQRLVMIAKRALEISNYDFGIPESGGYRTPLQQRNLYNQGLSKADGIKNQSKHQSGKALDIYGYVKGKTSYDHLHLTHIATCFFAAASELGVKIKWGGHFKSFLDMPHFEIVD